MKMMAGAKVAACLLAMALVDGLAITSVLAEGPGNQVPTTAGSHVRPQASGSTPSSFGRLGTLGTFDTLTPGQAESGLPGFLLWLW